MEPDDDGFLHICTSSPSVNPDGSEQVFRAEWRTEAVVGLARGIREDKAYERMPILADALEEAGCDLLSVLLHCREPIAHEGHCWVLARILDGDRPPPRELSADEVLQLLLQIGWREPGRRIGPPRAVRVLRRVRRLASFGCLAGALLLFVLLFAFIIRAHYLGG